MSEDDSSCHRQGSHSEMEGIRSKQTAEYIISIVIKEAQQRGGVSPLDFRKDLE